MRKVTICSLESEKEIKLDNFHDFIKVYQEYIEDTFLCDVEDIYSLLLYTAITEKKARNVFEYVGNHSFDLRSFMDFAFQSSWKVNEMFPDIYFLSRMLLWKNLNRQVLSNFPRKLIYEKVGTLIEKLIEKMRDWPESKIIEYFIEGRNSPYLASCMRFFQKYGFYNIKSFSSFSTGSYFESVYISGKIVSQYHRLRHTIEESGWNKFIQEKEKNA